jgi:hypothetical protein
MSRVKVLFLAADPATTPASALDEEIRAIDAKIQGATYRDNLELLSHWSVRLDELSGLLMRHRPHIVHFSGRRSGTEDGDGSRGEPIASRDLGPVQEAQIPRASPGPGDPRVQMPPGALDRLFRVLRENVRVVLLGASYTEDQALAITQSIDCVIGTRGLIRAEHAIAFAAEFYQALAYKKSVREAFDLGVVRLMGEGLPQADTLVSLYTRMSVDASALVLTAPAAGGSPLGVGTQGVLRKPAFHCGPPVPLDFFIDRESELQQARDLIEFRQSFMLVGKPRAGKSSFGSMLVEAMKTEGANGKGKAVGFLLDLKQYERLDVPTFMTSTLINLVGEIAHTVFAGNATTLSKDDPYEDLPSLRHDAAFKDLLELNREVVGRTHARGKKRPAALRTDEFERFVVDLVKIIRRREWSELFIVYDEANRLPLELSERFLHWNVEAFIRAGAVSVFAASPEMEAQFVGWCPQRIHLGPFLKVEDMLRLLSRYYYFGKSSVRDDLPISGEAIRQIWALSQGEPYLIQHLSNLSFERACKEGARRVEEGHVHAARAELACIRPGTLPD